LEAGLTVPDVPTAMKKSQSRTARLESQSGLAGINSSNNTMSGRSGEPQRGHGRMSSGTVSSS